LDYVTPTLFALAGVSATKTLEAILASPSLGYAEILAAAVIFVLTIASVLNWKGSKQLLVRGLIWLVIAIASTSLADGVQIVEGGFNTFSVVLFFVFFMIATVGSRLEMILKSEQPDESATRSGPKS